MAFNVLQFSLVTLQEKRSILTLSFGHQSLTDGVEMLKVVWAKNYTHKDSVAFFDDQ